MDTGGVQTTEKIRRTGFLTGKLQVPDDFDQMRNAEIEELFGMGGIMPTPAQWQLDPSQGDAQSTS
jgi:hypothetical protein